MRIQIFSDIHSDLAALERNARVEADLHICAGDLVSWARGLDACGDVLSALGKNLWVLPGNHESAEQIERFCEKWRFENFHGRTLERGGWHFSGLGYSSPTPFNTPGEYTEEQFAERLDSFPERTPLVLVCHCPPLGTALDQAADGRHFGSRSVGEFIQQRKPAHFFCGHVHEAAGVRAELGSTAGMNVGKAGYLLEL